ncbi:hypothetical protein IGB42_03956 [Andreprevotia sp. IGB-42]|uniref:type VI secretion system-associated protein TagF n=1 Tax=Andreprevotia sp. IGB-42 TaxID=2497473 RepID=UPI00135CA6EF|nr:type VI secretion system-associated protein TagF [Andreprevotia sp. IGB-42]KAF0811570.1 hypothetical protein IGB42_03956 [Andreprevotia sp. IGB-42]
MNMAEHMPGVPTVGWYGKIPSAGDFVTRQLSYPVVRAWERWMLNGLTALQQASPDMLPRHYAVAPVWNFLLPAGLGFDCVQLGALAPSCDRVGRYFPVAAVMPVPLAEFDTARLDQAGQFYRQMGETILAAIRHGHSPERLDHMLESAPAYWAAQPARIASNDILAVLQPGAAGSQSIAWPDLSVYFEAAGVTSFWWTHQGDGSPLQTHAHTGEMTNALFARLFGPQQGYPS